MKTTLMTSAFYEEIKKTHSSIHVKLDSIKGVDDLLDAVEANLNARQCIIDFGDVDINDDVKERLQDILSIRNDNSLVFYSSKGQLDDIPLCSQLFKIS